MYCTNKLLNKVRFTDWILIGSVLWVGTLTRSVSKKWNEIPDRNLRWSKSPVGQNFRWSLCASFWIISLFECTIMVQIMDELYTGKRHLVNCQSLPTLGKNKFKGSPLGSRNYFIKNSKNDSSRLLTTKWNNMEKIKIHRGKRGFSFIWKILGIQIYKSSIAKIKSL